MLLETSSTTSLTKPLPACVGPLLVFTALLLTHLLDMYPHGVTTRLVLRWKATSVQVGGRKAGVSSFKRLEKKGETIPPLARGRYKCLEF